MPSLHFDIDRMIEHHRKERFRKISRYVIPLVIVILLVLINIAIVAMSKSVGIVAGIT